MPLRPGCVARRGAGDPRRHRPPGVNPPDMPWRLRPMRGLRVLLAKAFQAMRAPITTDRMDFSMAMAVRIASSVCVGSGIGAARILQRAKKNGVSQGARDQAGSPSSFDEGLSLCRPIQQCPVHLKSATRKANADAGFESFRLLSLPLFQCPDGMHITVPTTVADDSRTS